MRGLWYMDVQRLRGGNPLGGSHDLSPWVPLSTLDIGVFDSLQVIHRYFLQVVERSITLHQEGVESPCAS